MLVVEEELEYRVFRVWPYGSRIPYEVEASTPSEAKRIVLALLIDEEGFPEEEARDKITDAKVEELID
jgi:hypothetical protein